MFTPTQPPWLFDLEGTVLNFLDNTRNRIKYLTLEVEQEQMTVILPKELAHRQPLNFQPGDRIRCIESLGADGVLILWAG